MLEQVPDLFTEDSPPRFTHLTNPMTGGQQPIHQQPDLRAFAAAFTALERDQPTCHSVAVQRGTGLAGTWVAGNPPGGGETTGRWTSSAKSPAR